MEIVIFDSPFNAVRTVNTETMRKLFLIITALIACAVALQAQTPQEIVARMDAEMAKADQQGMAVTMEIGIPILGKASSRMMLLGDNSRLDVTFKDGSETVWMDDNTVWTYNQKDNEVVIESRTKSEEKSEEDNIDMMRGITKGYTVELQKETADAWYFLCRKSKSNTDKDDPKKMTLIVSKANYLPIELTAKMKGVTVSMKDTVIGVKESDVVFDASKYPGVKVTDKR